MLTMLFLLFEFHQLDVVIPFFVKKPSSFGVSFMFFMFFLHVSLFLSVSQFHFYHIADEYCRQNIYNLLLLVMCLELGLIIKVTCLQCNVLYQVLTMI